jgi:hypothetical protein
MKRSAQRLVAVRMCTVVLTLGGVVFSPVFLSGCGSNGSLSADGLAFRQNDSIKIAVPAERELVSEPLTVEWTMDPKPAGVAGFMLFVDRGPQPPGKSIDHFKEDNRLNIYSSAESPFEIPAIERREGVAKKVRDHHLLTVIALDADGRRIGETAAIVDFVVFEEEL